MVKQVKIQNFSQVREVVSAASKCLNDIGVHDQCGAIADAKSILGLMNLDYSHPVKLVSEDAHELEKVYRTITQ